MSLKKSLNRVEYIDQLIRHKRTGTPKQLANKLGVSERWLYKLINELRYDLDCPIKYSKSHQSYIYTEEGRIKIEFINNSESDRVEESEIKFETDL